MSDRVEFSVTYSEHDFVRGMMHASVLSERSWLTIGVTAVAAFVSLGVIHWFSLRDAGPFRVSDLIWGAVAGLLSIGVAFGLERFRPSQEAAYRRMFRENPVAQESFAVTIDQNGIESRSSNLNNSVKWQAFAKAFESDDDFFFLLSRQQPLFFPKRAFTPGEMMSVRAIASQQMGDKAKFLR